MRAGLVVACLVLAGCADEGGAADEEAEFDVEVEVDESTGAIRGVVVDEAIMPLAEATVILERQGGPLEQVTDEQGRFAFSKVEPGTYFLTAKKPLHETVQFTAEVLAGVREPPIVKVQLPRLFEGDPFMVPISHEGYFTCSQARTPPYWYSSSSCHDTYWVNLSDYGVTLDQERTFHADVAEGWQTQVFEMVWEPSAQGTSERMGMVVSTEKSTREGSHSFANVEGDRPMRFQLDVGQEHETAGSTAPTMVPAEGMKDMSFFMSVRPPEDAVCVVWCVPPGLAFEQSFTVYLHQFYYLPAPEGWSIVNGDSDPF